MTRFILGLFSLFCLTLLAAVTPTTQRHSDDVALLKSPVSSDVIETLIAQATAVADVKTTLQNFTSSFHECILGIQGAESDAPFDISKIAPPSVIVINVPPFSFKICQTKSRSEESYPQDIAATLSAHLTLASFPTIVGTAGLDAQLRAFHMALDLLSVMTHIVIGQV
ncbi:hypothetical protein SISSUDRAFT_1037069 [Sistotremastrum suecicum HHB10207 ss-3]|uniref:Uncharacterized protein n=1 Tax=Sistotremastrum suecicum HHB10207 ss-3 TaxID=1314776 RepID=A0A165YMV9_9AGAM|nr:hypothetical protein SISSUDRAFT_1037069 [Sistotremastrum suecicum HHB10207 ss-3]